MLVARKGNVVWGVGDEEYVLRAATGAEREKARLSKDEAVAKMKELFAIAAPSSAGGAASAATSGAKPATSAPAPKK
jgi:hypothetical protein